MSYNLQLEVLRKAMVQNNTELIDKLLQCTSLYDIDIFYLAIKQFALHHPLVQKYAAKIQPYELTNVGMFNYFFTTSQYNKIRYLIDLGTVITEHYNGIIDIIIRGENTMVLYDIIDAIKHPNVIFNALSILIDKPNYNKDILNMLMTRLCLIS